jgi:UDP-GlcNAc3NAcA epimerase
MNIASIVGARPQFIKAAVISRAIQTHNQTAARSFRIKEIIIHTGQHFDDNMSRIFFEDLELPQPHHHLGIREQNHGAMTGRMLEAVEKVLLDERPDWVLVYGDTNSTLAGALAAAKLHIPVGHVEAGLRSYNRRMPEEINRVVTDHISALLFCPTAKSLENLQREGLDRILNLQEGEAGIPTSGPLAISPNLPLTRDSRPLVCKVGDVMYDAALYYGPKAEQTSQILAELSLDRKSYVLATMHRAENTDDPRRLRAIFQGLVAIARKMPVVMPVHPRTRKELKRGNLLASTAGLKLLDPVGYLDMILLEKNARVIVTDSGGVQKEAFFYGIPCVTVRPETEWVELVEMGWNRLVKIETRAIEQAVMEAREPAVPGAQANIYGTGRAGKLICHILLNEARWGN